MLVEDIISWMGWWSKQFNREWALLIHKTCRKGSTWDTLECYWMWDLFLVIDLHLYALLEHDQCQMSLSTWSLSRDWVLIHKTCKMTVTWHALKWHHKWAILTYIFMLIKNTISARWAKSTEKIQLSDGIANGPFDLRPASSFPLRTYLVPDELINMII